MKCPKCGYVSFEYLDQCKKCGKSLEAFKSEHGFYGYPPKDMMVIKFLEDKAIEEEAAVEETDEVGVATTVGEEDEDLENIISGIESVTKGSESAEDSATEISLDLEEADAGYDAEKIAAGLTESDSEKKSGEIELTFDEAEDEEASTEEVKEITLEIGDSEEAPTKEESVEIELSLDEVEVEESEAPVSAEKNESKDEISLDLDELNAGLEIDDEATIEEPKPKKKYDEDSEDGIKLELE